MATLKPTKEFEVTVTIRNNLLKARRLAIGLSAPKLAEAIGVSHGYYVGLESMKIDPIAKLKSIRGQWKPGVLLIAKYWKVPPEILFPNAILKVTNPQITQCFSEDELIQLSCSNYTQRLLHNNPENKVFNIEMQKAISEVLQTLTDKEKIILKSLYGIECDELMPDELSKIYDLSEEQIRTIEARSIQKLRHPQIFNKIKYFANRG